MCSLKSRPILSVIFPLILIKWEVEPRTLDRTAYTRYYVSRVGWGHTRCGWWDKSNCSMRAVHIPKRLKLRFVTERPTRRSRLTTCSSAASSWSLHGAGPMATPNPNGQPPKGAWKDDCCSCCNDCCICWSVLCCGCFTISQLLSRLMKTAQFFIIFVAGYLLLECLNGAFVSWSQHELNWATRPYNPYDPEPQTLTLSGDYYVANMLSGLTGFALFVITCGTLCNIRTMIKNRDNIDENDCCTCCMSCCCSLCSACQIFRHEGVDGSNYSLCAPFGSPSLDDGPGPQRLIEVVPTSRYEVGGTPTTGVPVAVPVAVPVTKGDNYL